MNFNTIVKMKELELETEGNPKLDNNSDDDCDTCDSEEIEKIFETCTSTIEKSVGLNKNYILDVAGTLENNPNVAVTLSNNTCEVYNLSNNQLAKISTLTEHTDVITEVKFSSENSNLLYTGSSDGSVKLWDIRTPDKSSVQFRDTTVENNKIKEINCFDVSPNNIFLAAGSNLFEGDAFILFWDVRKHSLLGGYWESHTDDITQVKFHSNDPNKLISASTDGLINLYDLSESKEEDALTDSLNTESSIEKLTWLYQNNKDIISCITHTAEVQFWKLDDAQPYFTLHRQQVAKDIKRKAEDYIYVVDVHSDLNKFLLLAGSNYSGGECFRGLSILENTTIAAINFPLNKQIVRTSWYNSHHNLLLTGGEKGILNVWKLMSQNKVST